MFIKFEMADAEVDQLKKVTGHKSAASAAKVALTRHLTMLDEINDLETRNFQLREELVAARSIINRARDSAAAFAKHIVSIGG